ncbi:phosphoribosylglycinamide formyltransferase [Candidatus Margulisiibacteriota bacterium]
MIKIAIIISGRGSNMEAIIKSCQAKKIDGNVELVISNKEDAKGLAIAKKLGIKTAAKKTEDEIVAEVDKINPDLICLAGYMKIVSPKFIQAYKNKIINIHPALLPAFPGLHVQKKALEHGVKYSGCTVHFVDEDCDTGPIIKQAVVPVLEGDTEESLSKRILKEEHKIYYEAIQLFAQNKLSIEGRIVHVKE